MDSDKRKQADRIHHLAVGVLLITIIVVISASVLAGSHKRPCSAGAVAPPPGTSPTAVVGKKAPDFVLTDLSGKSVSLSQFKGKIVVLEWFNPDCPFVNLAHGRALSLKNKAKTYKKQGIVWLAINSNGPGKQGHGVDTNKQGQKRFGIDYPILQDPNGKVGRLYGAQRTPHMYVIDSNGVLVYNGAIDNTRGGDPEDAEPGPATNHVDNALSALLKKRQPDVKTTTPWGCSVKYAR